MPVPMRMRRFHLELSPYNLLWSLLSSWVSRETLGYVAGRTARSGTAPAPPPLPHGAGLALACCP
jgi:hypothetical protein